MKTIIFQLVRFVLAVSFSHALHAAPVPVAAYDWKPVRVGAGGLVTGISVHPLNANVRYARTDVGNGYRWDVGTQTWKPIIVRDVELGTGLSPAIAATPAGLGVESLVVDPSNQSIVYIAFVLSRSFDVAAESPSSTGAIYKSTDAGITFTKTGLEVPMTPNGPTRVFGERMAVDPANSDVLYYGSVSSGLHRSINGGVTWTQVSAGGPAGNANVLNINFDRSTTSGTTIVNGQTRSAVIYAAAFEGDVFRSSDGGVTWSSISSGMALSGNTAFSTIDREGRLYVLQRILFTYTNPDGSTGSYRSGTNELWRYSAGTWVKLTVLAAGGSGFGGYGNPDGLTVDPNNSQRIFAMGAGGSLLRSTDAGRTWVLLSDSFRFDNTLAWLPQVGVGDYRSNGGVTMDRDGRLWSPQGNEGVLTLLPTANDSETPANPPRWTIQSRGIEELVGHDVILPPGSGDKPVVSCHDASGFFIDDPDQFSARQINLQDQLISNGLGLAYCPNAPEYVVLSASDINFTASGKNYSGFSNDGGRTWKPFDSQPNSLQCGAIAVSKRGSWSYGNDRIVILPATNRPPSYSHDGGKTWTLSTGFPVHPPGTVDANGKSIAGQYVETFMWNFSLRQRLLIADPFVPNKFYFSSLNDSFYTSIDGGVTWTPGGGAGLPLYGRYHSQFYANPVLQNDLWFTDGWEGTTGGATPHGLYRSTNGGTNFTRMPNVEHAITLAIGAGRGLAGDQPFTIYVYGKISGDPAWGVFRTTNAGGAWTRIAYNPSVLFDRPSMMAASMDTFGLLYIAYNGSSFVYGHPEPVTLPSFSLQPLDVSASTNQDISFTVKASSWPTYQWQRKSANSTIWTDILGANSAIYQLTATASDRGASFRAVATNAVGTVISSIAILSLPPLTALPSIAATNGVLPLVVQFRGNAQGGRLGTSGDTTDDGLGTISARGENGPGETRFRAFDNLPFTKWLDFSPDPATRASSLDYAYANGAARVIQSYALTSANDAPERDPADWALLGSNDGINWIALDTQQNQVFGSRTLRKAFTITNPAAYNRYRLRIDRVANPAAASCVQLAELELIYTAAYSYQWTFGDGATSSLQNPAHTFNSAGDFTTTLTVFDSDDVATSSLTLSTFPNFEAWRGNQFNAQELMDISTSGPSADPDADGLTNIMEYALLGQPKQVSNATLPTAVIDPITGRPQFSFLRIRGDLTYLVEGSNNLTSWATIATNPGNIGSRISVLSPTSTAPRYFMRLKVSR